MRIDLGLYKVVFIFDKFVVKIPRIYKSPKDTIMSFLELYTEKWAYILSTKEERKYLLPNTLIPILPINIMPTVRVLSEGGVSMLNNDLAHSFCMEIEDVFGESGGKFGDIKADNLGWYKGKLVKIDYGFPYIFHNLYIDIMNKFRKIN